MINRAQDENDFFVCKLTTKDLNKKKFKRLESKITKNNKIRRLGFNLSKLDHLSNDFLDFLKNLSQNKNISLYNFDAETLIPFYLMNYDSYVSLYLSEKDFVLQKNLLIRRNFKVCS